MSSCEATAGISPAGAQLEPALPLKLVYGGLYGDRKNRLWELRNQSGAAATWEAQAAAAAGGETDDVWVRVTTGSRPYTEAELAKELQADEDERRERECTDREFEEEMAIMKREFDAETARLAAAS